MLDSAPQAARYQGEGNGFQIERNFAGELTSDQEILGACPFS
jgi:hypothetical protein